MKPDVVIGSYVTDQDSGAFFKRPQNARLHWRDVKIDLQASLPIFGLTL